MGNSCCSIVISLVVGALRPGLSACWRRTRGSPRSRGGRIDVVAAQARHPSRRRRPTVVAGPWARRSRPRRRDDQSELDALLDKISATGMDSLSR